ncbi:MAG: phosphoribosylaminoimidazolesuccinocarboxamide synthase [Bacteroidota bacterium]|nr:phosphoribosylaminoimidazolesuccinocarboxamide synthase [Bacteroidota bacterium]
MTVAKNETLRCGRLLYEGRSKRVYETADSGKVFLEFKSEFPPRSSGRQGEKPVKSVMLCDIAEHVFQYLQSFRIPTHFQRRYDQDRLLVGKLDMIPLAIVVRNIAAGSLCTRFDVPEGWELEVPVIELIYRNNQLKYPLVNETHLLAFGVSTPEEIRTTMRIATKTNAVLRSFMERRKLRLVDIWLEFGRRNGEILLGDAIVPDTMRLLDMGTNELYDGSVYRLGIGDYIDPYVSLHRRILS